MIVACLQLDPSNPDRAWPRMTQAVKQAAEDGATVIVLPELALSGFDTGDPSRTRETAHSRDGGRIEALMALSDEACVVVVAGFAELAGTRVFNSAAVCDSGQLLGVYRKVHLWGDEPDHFVAATDPPLVVETSAGWIGVLICYDLEFPEWVRLAAEAGAELLTVPVNYPRYTDPPPGERPIELAKAQAGAATNKVAIAIADRCGPQGGLDWLGSTCIIGADGYLVSGPLTPSGTTAGPGRLMGELNLEDARNKRPGPRNHALSDRRPELYR